MQRDGVVRELLKWHRICIVMACTWESFLALINVCVSLSLRLFVRAEFLNMQWESYK